MPNKRRTSWSAFVFIFVVGCQTTPEDARKELVASGITYTPESFLDRVNAGDTKAVSLFLRAGMDPNTTSRTKIPAVFYATLNACNKQDHEKRERGIHILAALLTHGVDFGVTSDAVSRIINIFRHDWTPVMILAACGCTAGVSLFLEHGAPVESKDSNGLTSLILAAERGHLETVRQLLAHGANIEAQGGRGSGQTALIAAAENGRVDVVQLLLQHGADVTKRDWANRTALDQAEQRRHPNVAEILRSAGAV
jgi:uncharacterized protein